MFIQYPVRWANFNAFASAITSEHAYKTVGACYMQAKNQFICACNISQHALAQQFTQISLVEFQERRRNALPGRFCLADGSKHMPVSLWDGPSGQEPQRPLAIQFGREKPRGRAQLRCERPFTCASAQPPVEVFPDKPDYSPQRSISSATLHWLAST